LPECPGKKYFDTHDTSLIVSFNNQMNGFLPDLKPRYKVKASSFVSIQQVELGDKDCIFITNLKGLKGYSSTMPATEDKIEIEFESSKAHNIYFIPYLGRKQKITENVKHDSLDKNKSIISFNLPPVQFGGIVVLDK
jgi:hypothetical protein